MHTPVQAFTGLECPLQTDIHSAGVLCDLGTPESGRPRQFLAVRALARLIAFAGMTKPDARFCPLLECTCQVQSQAYCIRRYDQTGCSFLSVTGMHMPGPKCRQSECSCAVLSHRPRP